MKGQNGKGLSIRLTRARVGQGEFLRVELQAPARPPLDPELALVLDRSGSMAGDKLREAKRAARSLIHALPQGARLAVVAYHDEVEVGGFTRKEAKAFLASLEAGGSTALHAGWQRGVELLADKSRPRLVILLSDGLANMGLTDPEALAEEARRAASLGIYTVTLGFGEGYDRHLMAAMARAGGGVHHYVAQGELSQAFAEEIAFLSKAVNLGVRVALGGTILHLAPFASGEKRVFLLPVEGAWLEVAELLPEGKDQVRLPLPEPVVEGLEAWREVELEVLLWEGARLLEAQPESKEEAETLKGRAEALLARIRSHPVGETPRAKAMAAALEGFAHALQDLAQHFHPLLSDRIAREGTAYTSSLFSESRALTRRYKKRS